MMEIKRAQIEDPEVVELYRCLADVIYWEPDDPRLPEVADWLAASISKATASESERWEGYDPEDLMAGDFVELLDSYFLDTVPAAPRLLELLEERGWSGWTQFEPKVTG